MKWLTGCAVFAIATGLVSCSSSDAATGTSAQVVHQTSGWITGLSIASHNGTTIIAYSESLTGADYMWFRLSTDMGATWSDEDLNKINVGAFSSGTSVAIGKSNIYMLYVNGDTFTPALEYRVLSYSGWPEDSGTFYNESVSSYNPMYFDSTNIHAVFCKDMFDNYALTYARRDNDGAYSVQTLFANSSSIPAAVCAVRDAIRIAYYKTNVLSIVASSDGGSSWNWAGIVRIDTNISKPCLAMKAADDGHMYLLYSANSVSGQGLHIARSMDNGITWLSADIRVISGFSAQRAALTIAADNSVHVVFTDVNGLHYAKSTDNGDTWSVTMIESFTGDVLELCDVSIDGSTIYIACGVAAIGGVKVYRSSNLGDTW